MFNKFFKKKEKKKEEHNSILIAALLIHAAKIDENYTDIEKAIIKKAVIDLENVSPDEAEEIIKKADQKEQESNQIIEILWKIVYSDRTKGIYESNLIRRVCGLLYVSDKDNGTIKLKVEEKIK